MSISVTAAPPRRTVQERARLQRPELALLILLAAVLDLWSLGRNGWANTYYSAAVHSMSTSWHNFLYASFDQAGVMTVDKPPLALWVQALSARIFGFNSLSILVPQALMSIGAVALTYDLTRRRFGRAGGFVAGLVLATTPITVAIARHNNPDALLVLCCVAALWAIVRALEDGRTRWVVLAGVCVGLGFEAKMLAALLVVPAIAAAYFWVAPRGRAIAARQLAAGGAAMTVVGLAWPMLVWLTPTGSRPWISGTSDNSIWSLIFGYNGLGRLDGQMGGPGGGAGPGGGNGGPFGGSPGVLRLFNDALGGQAGWLLGAAVVGAIGLAVISRLRRTDPRTGWLIATGGSFATIAIAFSSAKGIFHPYYVSQLAPFTAALVGAVVTTRLAPLAIGGGIATELLVLHHTDGSLNWVIPLLVIVAASTAGMYAARVNARIRTLVVATAIGVLLLAPATWAAQTLGHATSGTFPAGGPAAASFGGGGGGGFGGPPSGGRFGGGGPFGGNSSALTEAAAYVQSHGGGTIAVSSQQGATDAIINSNVNVAALGGFSGRESEVSISWLQQAVKDGRVRYVLVENEGGGLPNDARIGSRSVMAYAAQVGRKVLTINGAALYDLS
jgi:4-amino-4-deoxy-L-arabinose transferase-like glycosyltransferase